MSLCPVIVGSVGNVRRDDVALGGSAQPSSSAPDRERCRSTGGGEPRPGRELSSPSVGGAAAGYAAATSLAPARQCAAGPVALDRSTPAAEYILRSAKWSAVFMGEVIVTYRALMSGRSIPHSCPDTVGKLSVLIEGEHAPPPLLAVGQHGEDMPCPLVVTISWISSPRCAAPAAAAPGPPGSTDLCRPPYERRTCRWARPHPSYSTSHRRSSVEGPTGGHLNEVASPLVRWRGQRCQRLETLHGQR